MIRIKNIMVPVDFSNASKKAVNYGLSFALESEARLILAHIGPSDAVSYDRTKKDLLELIPPDCRERLTFEIIVKGGNVQSELLGIVEDREVDLVVMGTHGRGYVERMLLGSVTERMLRKLHVPILTVSHLDPEREIHTPAPVAMQRILYATDMSEGSEEGLGFSIRLARAFDATLMVAHVIRFGEVAFQGVETAALQSDYAGEIRTRAEEELSRIVGLTSDGSVPIETLVAEGIPYDTIEQLARQHRADLIVINVQNKGRLERVVLGKTAECVIRTATVPVLSLPLPANYQSRWAAA